ncbi:MAG: PcfJ domain-containing protein [Hyphomicrobiaceae bacterium]
MRHTPREIPCAARCGNEAAEPGAERSSKRLEGFAAGIRPKVTEIARIAPQLEDLADSFPGLLFALATGFGSESKRRSTVQAVAGGRPLKDSAAILGLPIWLRRLPAQAFQRPLQHVPADPVTASRLISLVPDQPAAVGAWFDRILVAQCTRRTDMALWIAQQYRGTTPSPTGINFLRTLAWCWYSGEPGTRGHALLGPRWKPGIGARRAGQEASLWTQRIDLDVHLGAGIRDTWLAEGQALGFDFVALRTADDFIAEAMAMDNCLDRYADRLENRAVRIFSIRREGRSVANVEICEHERETGMPSVTQLRAPRNRRAPMEVWQATFAWLGGQTIRPAEPAFLTGRRTAARRRRLEAVWTPFLDRLPEDARLALIENLLPLRRSRRCSGDGTRAAGHMTSLPASPSQT